MLLFDGYIFSAGPDSRKSTLCYAFRPSGFDPLRIIQGQRESEISR